MNRTVQFATFLLVVMLTIGFTAPVAGVGAPSNTVVASEDVEIDSALEDADGEVEVVVRLAELDRSIVRAKGADALKEHAAATQVEIESFAQSRPGVTIVNQFWITNAVVVEIDTNTVDVNELAAIDVVQGLHANFTVNIPQEPESTAQAPGAVTQADYETTYGLAQINAPTVWSQFGTQGEGARIAVLDTGVDAAHQDINLYSDDPNDPTHPGGWAEIDGDGNVVEGSEPHDTGSHGTHVSGTVAGGDASGEYIGVAPQADLMHGLVLPGGSGTFNQIIGGMEWAIENDADAISMSLGADGYYDQFVDPIRNAQHAGVIVISAASNSGEGTSGSPGNLADGMAIGASDEDENIADFSSGEVINTDEAWGDSAPADWPDEYIVPDVAAPGVAVKSSVPGDSYDEFPGTSMATPHVSGVVALMVSANPDLLPDQIQQTLVDTAWKPDGESDGQDTRYGHGIVDAATAVATVAIDTGLTGTVVSEGEPVPNAEVSLDGLTTTTDANGDFQLVAEPGTYTLTISGNGIQTTSVDVTVEDGDEKTDVGTISVDPALYGEVISDQPEAVEAGDDVEVTLDAKNVETASISLTGHYDQANANLLVNGHDVEFDEVLQLGGFSGEVEVTVETDSKATGEFSLVHTATGHGDELHLTTGPTEVVDELLLVGLVGSGYLGDVEETLAAHLPEIVHYETVGSVDSVGAHDVYVVQDLATVDTAAFVEATAGDDVGVVYLDQWGAEANAIPDFEAVSDDVSATFEDDNFFGDAQAPIYYEATDEHPILDGIAVGEQLLIHDGQFADHTWFESSFDEIATVNDAVGQIGSALAVDDDSATVLASSLGYTEFVNHEQYSDEADRILANSVAYLFPESDDEPGDGGYFTVDEIDAQPVAEPGEEIQVLAAVSNMGESEGTTTVTVSINGVEQSSTELTLGSHEWESLAFLATVPEEPGIYNITVTTADDSLFQQIQVDGDDPGTDPGEVVLDVGDAQGEPGGSATVTLSATGDGVAGYEALLVFDPTLVQFAGASGIDFADPETNAINEEGVVKIAQAQETGEDDPVLAALTFDVIGEEGQTPVSLYPDETLVNDEQGNVFDIVFDDGTISVEEDDSIDCELGDVNGDGQITAADATLTQRYIVGLPIDGDFNPECADVTQDGDVHTGDVVAILQEVVDF